MADDLIERRACEEIYRQLIAGQYADSRATFLDVRRYPIGVNLQMDWS